MFKHAQGSARIIHLHPRFDTRSYGSGRMEAKVTPGDVTHSLNLASGIKYVFPCSGIQDITNAVYNRCVYQFKD